MAGRNFLYVLIVFSSLFFSQCSVNDIDSDADPISHELWDSLLQKHIYPAGKVDYPGMIRDSNLFHQYLSLLKHHHPDDRWSREERMAYWINAYNAFTVKIVVDNYPTKSIKAIKKGIPFINSVWDIKFIQIEGNTYDLNNIEHGILRSKFKDPRIHFAINCASVSCPDLRNKAYTADSLDEQLNSAAITFLNNKSKNIIRPDRVQLSRIFKWFRGDFTAENGDLISFLNKYTAVKITTDARMEYLKYNWKLNGK